MAVQAHAQCSMCKTAAAQSAGLSLALNKGIFILLVPAVLLFAIIFLSIRRPHQE